VSAAPQLLAAAWPPESFSPRISAFAARRRSVILAGAYLPSALSRRRELAMLARLLSALAVLAVAASTPAAEPLHVRIDRLIDAKAAGQPLSASADDGEFLRRAYLDFAGRIPTADEVKRFLGDNSSDKRAKLIDALLARPEYAAAMAGRFHLMLMERLGDHSGWRKYLRESFAANRPWNAMVRDMLRADPTDEKTRAAAFFLSKRLEHYGQNPVDYSALTRDVGRLFLGKDFRCCECHDHLFIDDYKQKDFQGLHAFFKNTMLVDAKLPIVGEKPTTEKTRFVSVFTKIEMHTAPALPGGVMLEIPTFGKGHEFATPPDRKTRRPGVPKFSTLRAISERLPSAANRDFARNAVNRLWFLLLGRGLVHPLDLHHSRNPPSHPELLKLLADEFVSHKFDIKYLLREIASTRAYQRSSRLPAGAADADPKLFLTALERRLSAEQLFASVITATGAKPTDALKAKFVKAFANSPRDPEEEYEPSLKAALFVLHDPAVLELLQPKPGNLVHRLAKLKNADVADELYPAVLTRRPTAEERATVAKLLAKHANEREAAIGRLAWALLASMEFGVNH
jgi:hypothetical protein